MTEWSKLKVPDLKAELKKRGLPQTGLKAELVARLTVAENESGFESEATVKGDTVEPSLESSTSADVARDADRTPSESQDDLKTASDSHPLQSQSEAAVSTATLQDSAAATINTPDLLQSQPSPPPSENLESFRSGPSDGSGSNLNSADLKEVVEDKQKRKRRSQSPPPSSTDVRRKRARPDDETRANPEPEINNAMEGITPDTSAESVEKQSGADPVGVDAESDNAFPSLPGVVSPSDIPVATEADTVPAIEPVGHKDVRPDFEERQATGLSELPYTDASPARTKDSRFKGLFSTQSERSADDHVSGKPGTQFDPLDAVDAEPAERFVAPSIHPATSALYIRDFMRPLNAATLREHLTVLATAPGLTPDLDTIVDFYLDPIRTHAFVSFRTTSAASRVRSELHNRIWPNERNRKPLWADFIPLEKIKVWIAEEQASSSGVRSAGKKWEVVYSEDDARNVTLTLQEVGAVTAPARSLTLISAPSSGPSLSRLEGPPSGPRSQQITPRPQPSRSQLDVLFKSTVAKPLLYFQPVHRDLANKRLDHLEDATSKRYSSRDPPNDINRYTFEDGDSLVDRGPEIFSGIRPPPGYRGRGGGGRGGGRGGGFRDRGDPPRDRNRDRDGDRDRDRDRERERGDGYRDRGDRYEGIGRDTRDSRDRRY